MRHMWRKREREEESGAWLDHRDNQMAAAVPLSSAMLTGPFNWLQRTLPLGDANDPRTANRAFLFAIISWLPLVALAGVQGLAISDDPRKSLLLDFTVYARFLLAIPLFILGEKIAYGRYTLIVNYLVHSGIIADSERQSYDDLLFTTHKLRNSRLAKIVWVILAFAVASSTVYYHATSEPSTWLVAEGHLSWAGAWYTLVSLPLFQFLFYRSIWSWFIWVRFLRRLSNSRLRLMPTHPDHAGGINILGDSPYAISVFVFAIGLVLSAALITQVSFKGASVVVYHKVFIVYLVLAMMISFGPLLVFLGKFDRLRQLGLRDIGTLASHQTQLFDEKWVKRTEVTEDKIETPLNAPDISSISGLKASYETVRRLKFFPFDIRAIVVIAAAALIPMIPLMLMEFPLQKILKTIAGFVL